MTGDEHEQTTQEWTTPEPDWATLTEPEPPDWAALSEPLSVERRAVELCGTLGALLDQIDAGQLDANERTRARIEGARIAMRVALGADTATALGDLTNPC